MADFTLDPSQKAAVELVCSAPIAVVTGGAGTGKTTILREALDRLDAAWTARMRYSNIAPFRLASPTGKAAKRLSEATGRQAQTIHRLLEYGPLFTVGRSGLGFRRDADNPLKTSLVVIDEASMIDIELMASLYAAIRTEHTRLVLVGDANQLPSVGPGAVFRDLIRSGAVPVARLTTLHRAAAESWVCTQAPRVLAGELPDLRQRPDFRWVPCETAAQAVEAVVELHAQLREQAGEAPMVLTPQKVHGAGANVLNKLLQETVNPLDGQTVLIGGEARVSEGDPVIQVRNDYEREVFNGEIGEVIEVDKDGLAVDFDGRAVEYSRDVAPFSLRLAYALTIHKSQGSEWPWVIVLCHSTHTRMLSRQLLYTAITRAKKGVVLVGDAAGLRRALSNQRDAHRNTLLVERIRGEV